MEIDDEEEAIHQDHALRAFNAYRYQHLAANNLRRQSYANLPFQHQELLPNQQRLLLEIDHCIVGNAELLEDICSSARRGSLLVDGIDNISKPKPKVTDNEMEKLRSTLRQLHRDWSDEGKAERDSAYLPILDFLSKYFPNRGTRSKAKVLVPGCGLARLPYEIAKLGFSTQGNEFSLFMLCTANYILNETLQPYERPIHPFCHSIGNIWNREGATRTINIPDEVPSRSLRTLDMTMAAGDFLEIYKDQLGEWDCIVTCFFIDTARNVVKYLETIAGLLAPNGVWINLGPSLWHFEGTTGGSIDLPMDELKALARRIGFRIENEQTIEMTYTSNPASMMRYTYAASFWTATLENSN